MKKTIEAFKSTEDDIRKMDSVSDDLPRFVGEVLDSMAIEITKLLFEVSQIQILAFKEIEKVATRYNVQLNKSLCGLSEEWTPHVFTIWEVVKRSKDKEQ